MHLDDDLLQRWVHDELGADPRQALAAHLATCVDCQSKLSEAQAEDAWVREQLERGVAPVPALAAETIRRRAHPTPWLRWAAAILLSSTLAGAAYALPGSPLPGWLHQVGEWLAGTRVTDPAPSPVPPRYTTGIAVPVEPRLTIRFRATQSAGVARVTLVEGRAVAVRVHQGTATFATQPGMLAIDNRGSTASYDIELPRAAAWIAIDLGERRLLLKRDSLIDTSAQADSTGGFPLPLFLPAEP